MSYQLWLKDIAVSIYLSFIILSLKIKEITHSDYKYMYKYENGKNLNGRMISPFLLQIHVKCKMQHDKYENGKNLFTFYCNQINSPYDRWTSKLIIDPFGCIKPSTSNDSM